MKISETTAIARISELGMDDMPVMEYTPTQSKLPADWFNIYTVANTNHNGWQIIY